MCAPSPLPLGEGRVRESCDEHVQYAGVFARGVERWREQEARFVYQARAGSWIYQEDFVGGL